MAIEIQSEGNPQGAAQGDKAMAELSMKDHKRPFKDYVAALKWS